MEDKDLQNMWKSQDQKLDNILTLNKALMRDMLNEKLRRNVTSLRLPKRLLLLIGIPYTILLCFITWVAYQAGGFFVMVGFGMISIIMIATIIGYCYQLYLITKIRQSDEILEVQKKMAELKISSFNIAKLAVIQLPFWSICWMSLDALKSSPIIYGGINLIVFIGLSYVAYLIYQKLNVDNVNTKIGKFFFSGIEWDPIIKSNKILEQIGEYDRI